MWTYNEISRKQFEEKKNVIEQIILKPGGLLYGFIGSRYSKRYYG